MSVNFSKLLRYLSLSRKKKSIKKKNNSKSSRFNALGSTRQQLASSYNITQEVGYAAQRLSDGIKSPEPSDEPLSLSLYIRALRGKFYEPRPILINLTSRALACLFA